MKKLIEDFAKAEMSVVETSKIEGGAGTWNNRTVAEKGDWADGKTYIDYSFDGGTNYLCDVRD